MKKEQRINVEIFKIVSKSIAESDNLEIMTGHLCQLLVAALVIKGGAIFALNPATNELETLASFGLSPSYLSKGPLIADKSIAAAMKGKAVIIGDISKDTSLQYPKEAAKEGIASILSIPIIFSKEILGVLRLYHREVWDVSEQDIDSLLVLAENIGLSLRYTRLLNALQSIKEAIKDLPLEPTLF